MKALEVWEIVSKDKIQKSKNSSNFWQANIWNFSNTKKLIRISTIQGNSTERLLTKIRPKEWSLEEPGKQKILLPPNYKLSLPSIMLLIDLY
jgi:hypothetical protein